MTSRNHDDAMADYYREHPDFAADMLTQIFEDGQPGDLSLLLRQLTLALPEDAVGLHREALLTLTDNSLESGPTTAQLIAVMRAMHVQLKASASYGSTLEAETQAA